MLSEAPFPSTTFATTAQLCFASQSWVLPTFFRICPASRDQPWWNVTCAPSGRRTVATASGAGEVDPEGLLSVNR